MVPPQPHRQTHPLKGSIERPFHHGLIRQGRDHFLRDLFPAGKIDHLHFAAIYSIPKQQNVKVRMLHILVHTALIQVIS